MMNPFTNKHIVLGVTGSVAAYKAVELASRLTQSGAIVDVVITEGALKFVSALQFQSVTGRKAYTDADLWGGEAHVVHVNLGHSADLLVIAPVTASTMAKLAHGLGDNLLSVSALAAKCPLVLAPAMDLGMYQHTATQNNIAILKERGAIFIGPAEGHLASGLIGPGRFEEPANILGQIRFLLSRNGPLKNKKIVVSAGGTQEAIDPVRLITNRSSGKQGYAIAQSALDAGADVTLVSATAQIAEPAGAKMIHVRSAKEMLDSILSETTNADSLIMAAAVSDFQPARVAEEKIKKGNGGLEIKLIPTRDILMDLDERKAKSGFPKITIGFAAESEDLLDHAAEKLAKKGLDMIVANDISQPGKGFETDVNQVVFLLKDGTKEDFPQMPKTEIADLIVSRLVNWLK